MEEPNAYRAATPVGHQHCSPSRRVLPASIGEVPEMLVELNPVLLDCPAPHDDRIAVRVTLGPNPAHRLTEGNWMVTTHTGRTSVSTDPELGGRHGTLLPVAGPEHRIGKHR